MYYTVYKTTNLINNKTYIGAHKTEDLEHDSYCGSGTVISRALNKYGLENFSKEIIFRAASEPIMYWVERMLVDEECVQDPTTYNLKLGGEGGFDHINSDVETRKLKNRKAFETSKELGFLEKAQERLKILRKDEEWESNRLSKFMITMRERYGRDAFLNFLGKTHSEESKAKIGKANSKLTGERNSQFGTIWICNIESKEVKKIQKSEFTDYEISGWRRGRKCAQ